MDSDKIGFVRAIINDAHYLVPALCIIALLLYMGARFAWVVRNAEQEEVIPLLNIDASLLSKVDLTKKINLEYGIISFNEYP